MTSPWLKTRAGMLILLTITVTAAFAVNDPADAEKTADHPEIARFPGFHIDSSKRNDFNEFLFATQGYDAAGETKGGETKSGKYWFIDYCLNENARHPSGIELFRNYENAFKRAGGTLVSRNPKTGWPEVSVFRMPLTKGERWVQLNIDNDGERYRLTIVEAGAMEQKLEFSAGEMAKAIRATGHVALTGVLFDTAQASIKAESVPLLNEVLALLRNDKFLRLAVEGHTDNVGHAATNLDLSRRRAEAIVAFLVKGGVAPQRLKAAGKGDTIPVADNRTAEGRAQNRRVELVKL